ncbi:MAG: phosphoribosylformylglycinamidine synthase subunit PurL [Alphaproteobacteria bacterium]|nr:phosphoribosylformylglycinamidine synthase subunit PurL [Alphaproteobacteria bacterium]
MMAARREPAVDQKLASGMGLSAEEYARILALLGRTPNLTELGIFSAMWSEHCSYKSSKKWLKTLPTTAPWVICGPGENAGVIDIGQGWAAIFKMESHNHPSFIEPYQGAATGVGGILRDVFTMGARPIAIMDPLRFGAPDHPKTRHLVAGVVAGIGGYGNCIGVPTVGGECTFHPSYNGNILVNAMTVGLARADRIFYSKAAGVGNPVIYVGSKTGRDGIHGATMASAEFDERSEEKRPTVQVGDPFTEKLLLEACLELMATDAIVAIQDMGAAGLTSSSFEMASKGGVGIEIDLDRVPTREPGMSAYELMLSESQERMLMILEAGREPEAEAIFRKWELDFAVIGRITDSGRMILRKDGQLAADLEIAPLVASAPEYERPWTPTPARAPLPAAAVPGPPKGMLEALAQLLDTPDLCSKRWVWEQYDHMVMADTAQGPGGDAAVVRIHDSNRALAITTDCTPRYVAADPVMGGRQAVAESWRNLTAVGARPLAITDCMNFGNPQRPEIMGQFVGAIQGMGEACRALDYPVVSGNVSLYNETSGKGIQPTPAIGGVGLVEDLRRSVSLAGRAGLAIYVVGETRGHLGSSVYLRELWGSEDGAPPPVDLAAERRHGDFVRAQILAGHVGACHDTADGGLLVAVAEMAIAGGIGAHLQAAPAGVPAHAFWFGEDQARYVLAIAPDHVAAVTAAAAKANVPLAALGRFTGTALTLPGETAISVAELRRRREAWLPRYMGQA